MFKLFSQAMGQRFFSQLHSHPLLMNAAPQKHFIHIKISPTHEHHSFQCPSFPKQHLMETLDTIVSNLGLLEFTQTQQQFQ